MGASKRSNYSRKNSYSNPGKDVARNIGVVAGLGGLSFFLGFFVLAKMVPDKHSETEATSSATPLPPPAPVRQTVQTASTPIPSSPRETRSTPTVTSAHKDSAAPGVTIEPDEQTPTQKPHEVDPPSRSALPDSSASPADDSVNATHSTTAAVPTAPHDEVGSPTTETTGTAKPVRRKPRLRGHSADSTTDLNTATTDNGGISEGDQKPSRIDRDESDTAARSERHSAKADSGDAANEETPPPAKPAKRTRYRVVAGSYTQRESAERRAERVKELGLDADVVPVTKDDGTTVYRVQQGIYRKRANAEAAQKKLSDAGMDADVVKTGSP